MTYQVLARKWRPKTFNTLVGQEHVVRALVNALDNDRLHHAFLFTGTRGVGKTTIARIFAKSLNCLNGVGSEPCGVCQACEDIDQGRFVDLIEVDAASRTKVDDTRELLDNVQYAPTRARYKVYLIDEVHMLSNHSFNALLKTLEEPPEHVKFLLATTDPQKLPVTVLSRCLQFNLKRLSSKMIADYLEDLLKQEEIPAERAAVDLVADAADGSMRDALSLLDQAIAFSGGELQLQPVKDMLGTVEQRHMQAILTALCEKDATALWDAITEMDSHSPDYDRVLRELASLLHQISAAQLIQGLEQDQPLVQQLSTAMSREDSQLYYQIAIHGRRDLNLAPDPRSGFEMTMLRMLAFKPASATAVPSPAPTQGAAIQGSQGSPAALASSGRSAQPPFMAEPETPSSVPIAAAEPAVPAAAPTAQAPLIAAPASNGDRGEMSDWHQLVERLGLRGTASVLASNSILKTEGAGRFRLLLDPTLEHLHTETAEQKVREGLQRVLGQDVQIKFELNDDPNATSPARKKAQDQQAKMDGAHQEISADPFVKGLQDEFGATVLDQSVKPIEPDQPAG